MRKTIRIACIQFMMLGAFVSLTTACSSRSATQIMSFSGATMGTTYNIKVSLQNGQALDVDALKAEVDNELQSFNQIMSTYIPSSEISRFNDRPVGEVYRASAGFMRVVALSQEVSKRSEGAFDITVGPLVNLWGFGPEERNEKMPSSAQIDAIKAKTGFHNLNLDTAAKTITKIAEVDVDLSAVAKGDGVDHISAYLVKKGFTNFMVEIGGELYLKGQKEPGKSWRIGVVSPEQAGNSPAAAVVLRDVGMATSGDYRNYFEVDGQRFSHTINPRTGRPIKHNLASVTVIANTAAEADAWATAFSVMGGEKSLSYASEHNMAIYLIERRGGKFSTRYSDAFKPYFSPLK